MSGALDFGRTTANAAKWAFVATGGAKVITLAGLVVLARLIAPAEFGLIAFAMAYIVYVDTIGDLGTGTALIYWPDRRHDAAQITFLVNAAAGVFWCGITFLTAPLIADFFNAPQGTAIVRALAIGFVIQYLGNTHDALTRKDLRFRARVIPEIAQAVVKAIVAVALAWKGFGAWSLVWAHLSGLIAWTGLLWVITPWRPSRTFPSDLLRPMLSYGRGIVFVNVLAAIQDQTDLVFIGRWQGLTSLGLYQMAGRIPEATVTVIVRVAKRVLMPAFARVWATGRNPNEEYLFAARYIGAATLPVVTGLALLAHPLVLLFFGPQWIAAAPIASALTVVAGIRALATHPGDVLKAIGRVNLLARISVVRVACIVVAVIIAARWSALTVALALVVVDGLVTLVAVAATARAIELSLAAVGRAYAPSFAAAAVMGAAVVGWRLWGPTITLSADVAIAIALGAVTYLLALRVTDPAIFTETRSMLFSRPQQNAE